MDRHDGRRLQIRSVGRHRAVHCARQRPFQPPRVRFRLRQGQRRLYLHERHQRPDLFPSEPGCRRHHALPHVHHRFQGPQPLARRGLARTAAGHQLHRPDYAAPSGQSDIFLFFGALVRRAGQSPIRLHARRHRLRMDLCRVRTPLRILRQSAYGNLPTPHAQHQYRRRLAGRGACRSRSASARR